MIRRRRLSRIEKRKHFGGGQVNMGYAFVHYIILSINIQYTRYVRQYGIMDLYEVRRARIRLL